MGRSNAVGEMEDNPVTVIDTSFVGPAFARVRFPLKEKWAVLSVLAARREALLPWHVKVVKALNREFKARSIRFERRTENNAGVAGWYDPERDMTTIVLTEREMESFFRKRWDLFEKSYQGILRKLKNVIRHEKVHSAQKLQGEEAEELIAYLTAPEELEARAQEAAAELFQQSGASAYTLVKKLSAAKASAAKLSALKKYSPTLKLYSATVEDREMMQQFLNATIEYLAEFIGE